MEQTKRMNRWYFGGLAATSAAVCTHPLDLLKTVVQTPNVQAAKKVAQNKACHSNVFYAVSAQGGVKAVPLSTALRPALVNAGVVAEEKVKLGLVRQTMLIVRTGGIGALYNGLQASMLRQMFHSTTRYGIYEVLKQKKCPHGEKISLMERIGMATFSGTLGGMVGTPPDVVKIRMQNDVKLPVEQRRNYKGVFDGLLRIVREEGFTRLFRGVEWAAQRTALVTVGQIAFYDATKDKLIQTGYFDDNIATHFTASIFAGTVATFLSQPIDVCKTLAMNAKPGEFSGPLDLYNKTRRQGLKVFTKGFVPAFVRLGPQTILTWIFLEQFRLNFGKRVPVISTEMQPESLQSTKRILLPNKVLQASEK